MNSEPDGQNPLVPQIHSTADVQSNQVGGGTRVWQWAVILPGAVIGDDCNICSHVFIENDVVLGDRVTIKSGVQLWDGVCIEDDVFVGPNATFSNDRYPRSKNQSAELLDTILESGCSIGANATILPGVKVGRDSMVGAGSVVTADIPAGTVVAGNPARIIRYLTTAPTVSVEAKSHDTDLPISASGMSVRTIDLKNITDLRGKLSVAESEVEIPFPIKRVFFVYGVPSHKIRGEHAHKCCHQVLIPVSGSVRVALDDGQRRIELVLDTPGRGVLIPAGIWAMQFAYSSDSVLCVFASEPYDEADYIRSYSEYLRWRACDD